MFLMALTAIVAFYFGPVGLPAIALIIVLRLAVTYYAMHAYATILLCGYGGLNELLLVQDCLNAG